MPIKHNISFRQAIVFFLAGLIVLLSAPLPAAGESLQDESSPEKSLSDKPLKDKSPATNPCLEELKPAKIWDDISGVITFPARMDLAGGLILTGVLGATGILLSQDESIRERMRDIPDNDGTDIAGHIGKWLGNGYLIAPLFLVSGTGGYLAKNRRLVRISVETLEALALSGLAVQILKVSTGRARPFRDSGSWDFTGPSFTNEAFHSFPSGHAVTIASVAGVLAGEFKSVWIDLAAGGLVGLTAFQRIYADKHWASDVFLGSAIGIATGYSIARHREENAAARILVTPVSLRPAQPGIQLTYLF